MPPSCKPLALIPPPPLNPAFCFSVTFTMASMTGDPSTACDRGENWTLTFSKPLVLVKSVMSSDMRPESVAPGLMFLRCRKMYSRRVLPSHGSRVLRSMNRTSTCPICGSTTSISSMPSGVICMLTNSWPIFFASYHCVISRAAATTALLLSTLPICGFMTPCTTVTGSCEEPLRTTARTVGLATSLNLSETPSRVSVDSGSMALKYPVL